MTELDYSSSEEEEVDSEDSSIERLYTQIQSVPDLVRTVASIDQHVLSRFKEIESTALTLIHQFDQRKEEILQKFDRWLLPVAKEALDQMTQDGEQLRKDLEEAFQDLDKTAQVDWIEYAKKWVSLYSKWYDNKDLTEKVLKLVSDKTTQLIDKDIKVVSDYQKHSLAQLSQDSATFEDIELRLKKVTDDSLKALHSLKQTPSSLSLKQASEWVAHIHKERESHFDHVLLKIDGVMKDAVAQDNIPFDPAQFIEIENEIDFMESELKVLNEKSARFTKKTNPQDIEFIVFCLEGLKDHIIELDVVYAPREIMAKLDRIQQAIDGMIIRLKEFLD